MKKRKHLRDPQLQGARRGQGPCNYEDDDKGKCQKLATRGLRTPIGDVYVCAEHWPAVDKWHKSPAYLETVQAVLADRSKN